MNLDAALIIIKTTAPFFLSGINKQHKLANTLQLLGCKGSILAVNVIT